jgi:hypothetical protein
MNAVAHKKTCATPYLAAWLIQVGNKKTLPTLPGYYLATWLNSLKSALAHPTRLMALILVTIQDDYLASRVGRSETETHHTVGWKMVVSRLKFFNEN